jgi:flagellar biosynthesis/type III secretory pathway M-ring protein FliF/YscJ
MNNGGIITLLPTLLLLLLFFLIPLVLRFIEKAREKRRKQLSAAARPKSNQEEATPPLRNDLERSSEPARIQEEKTWRPFPAPSSLRETTLKRIEKLPPMKRAIVFSEILGKPVGQREDPIRQ